MRSKAHFRGDPIHAALVHFPVAFLLGAALLDLAGLVIDVPSWWHPVSYVMVIGGVGTALLAAIPGFIDFFYTVPPASSARKRATLHMIVNLSAVLLFGVAWYLRGHPEVRPEPVLVGIETAGGVLLSIGGALGGRLMAKNQIGVDTKHAQLGRWREVTIERSGDVVATTDELQVDQMKLVRLNRKRIVLARDENGFMAFDDHCTHKGGSLAGGVMICGTVQCPWHGSQFDVRTGAVKCGPAETRIDTYRVEVADGAVRLFLS